MNKPMNKLTSEQKNKQTNEQMRKLTNKHTNEQKISNRKNERFK